MCSAGLAGGVGSIPTRGFWEVAMAWAKETLKRIDKEKPPIDERFADLLRKVASGTMSQDDAWSTWLEIKDNNCTSCDGYGGIAFVGTTGPGITCGRCKGTGKV